jgi:hypothetical protein
MMLREKVNPRPNILKPSELRKPKRKKKRLQLLKLKS